MPTTKPLSGKKVLCFIGDIYEDLELLYPKYRLKEAGAQVVVAGPEANTTYKGKHGYPSKSDTSISEIVPDNYDLLVIPGGFMPDKLRRDPNVLKIVREFHQNQKPIAVICHGGWIPISAGVLNGVKITGSPGIKDDLVNAGAEWVDEAVVIDKNFVSSRNPDDLPEFCHGIFKIMGIDELSYM